MNTLKKEKLKVIDRAISTVKMQGKLKVGKPKDKGKCCGWYSKDYAQGFNAYRGIILRNLQIERMLIVHNVNNASELGK